MLRRVVILLKPSASSETRRDATNSLTNFFAASFFRGPGQFASNARSSRNKAPFLDDPRPLDSFIKPSYTRRTRKSRGSNDKMLLRNFNAYIFCVSSLEGIRDGWRRKNIVCSFMITSGDAVDATLHRHERVLGVDAVRVEHVRVAAHRREEHVLQYGSRK